MAITIEVPRGENELTEFILFHDRVYANRAARWTAPLPFHLSILGGGSPLTRDREIRPFLAREGNDVVARAAAVVDQNYMRHWNERLGHIILFEALPGSNDAVRRLMDEACDWLGRQGMEAARAGFGFFDFPFAVDAYDVLPPNLLRQNPSGYHVLIKQAGFETEKGFVDYKIRVRPELVERWTRALEGARRAGYAIVPLKDVPRDRRVREFADTWADTFKAHWGFTPFTEEELACLFEAFEPSGILETSVLAYQEKDPVGMLFFMPDEPEHAVLAPGRVLDEGERLNVLGIGVRERARGRGVNYAMAGYAFLELVRRGWNHLSYTLVLDDNWPSRRTGEGLGATLCANYLAYRRNFADPRLRLGSIS